MFSFAMDLFVFPFSLCVFTWIVTDGYWLFISFCPGLGEETILVQDSINRPSTRTVFFYMPYCCQYQNDLSCLLPESFKLIFFKLGGNGCWFLIWLKEGLSVFLGGLSLHLNHLIAERVSAHYWQFGTLPIGIFLSNLVSGQLETSLMTSYCYFWNLSTFGNSRAVWVFWPKLGVFRKSKFSRWRSDGASMRLRGFR